MDLHVRDPGAGEANVINLVVAGDEEVDMPWLGVSPPRNRINGNSNWGFGGYDFPGTVKSRRLSIALAPLLLVSSMIALIIMIVVIIELIVVSYRHGIDFSVTLH
jgi:hypothetical protein